FYAVVPSLALAAVTPLIMMISFRDDLEHRYAVNTIVSVIMALCLTFVDILEGLGRLGRYPIVPALDHVVLLSVYIFLPIGVMIDGKPYFLGMAVSLIYFCYRVWMVTLHSRHILGDLSTYVLYLFILNLMMMYFKHIRLFLGRQWILRRYQLVYESITFEIVLKREKVLLDSVMPRRMSHFLQEDVMNRIEEGSEDIPRRSFRNRKLYIEPHPEVTILMADMVNYTYLTTTLKAHELVEILHELFVDFDLAALKNQTMRIKFLGDAYICVAGIPKCTPAHANSCVNQALDMITITKDIGSRRRLDMNLRVGVHTGEVLAGIIGHTKWQFDIWSRDVDITNRLEASGRPGMVHISGSTMMMLDDEYVVERGTEAARVDKRLQTMNTYLISRRRRDVAEPSENEGEELSPADSLRFSCDDVYEEVRNKTLLEMAKEGSTIPDAVKWARFSKVKKKLHEINVYDAQVGANFISFRSWRKEWAFLNQPDLLMKYSMVVVAIAGVVVLNMDVIDTAEDSSDILMLGYLLPVLLLSLLCIVKKLWQQKHLLTPMSQPNFVLFRWLLKGSDLIEQSLLVRTPVAILSLTLLYFIVSHRVINCNIPELELAIIDADLNNEKVEFKCFLPWCVTYSVVVVATLLFVIRGIPSIVKLCACVAIVGTHLITIHAYHGFAFERSETTKLGLKADLAHTWYLIAHFIGLLIWELDVMYNMKAMFLARELYLEKQMQTQASTRSIKIIMANILPSHVSEVFKQRHLKDQLYSENFSKVAVMFAIIDGFPSESAGLRLLHEFICFFDDLLAKYQNEFKVEKIKVMGWTYMACCGLDVEHYTDFAVSIPVASTDFEESSRFRESSERIVRFASSASGEGLPVNDSVGNDAVMVMTQFAVDLLRIMLQVQVPKENTSCLKIGISHGPVMAGVVGLSKPYYDIWGHTVNMASRMASTGLLDEIQVTQKTAKVLRSFNVRCDYRGETIVKGVGEVPTYLVALDKNLNFQKH
ncbi:hypothetical protein KR018_008386, partial [Drosophila ironensis]